MNMFAIDRECSGEVTPVRVCEQMLELLGRYKAHMAQLAEANGLTMPQLHALHTIADGHNTMGKVARALHCDASNATGIIDRLKTLSLVTREEDPEDRRVKTVQLTPQGATLLKSIVASLPEHLGCNRLNQRELETLNALIIKLA